MAFACLMYHSLSDGRFPDGEYLKYTTTRALFAEHLRVLLNNGFQLATFSDLLRRLQAGDVVPDNYCVLSFDDGHKSSLDLAQLMNDAGTRGTFFLTMNYCREREDFLKPAEMRALVKAGFDFGTHGASQRALSRMPRDEMRNELRDSKAWLEDILGHPVQSMSLPAGQGSRAVSQAACELGYQLIGKSVERLNRVHGVPMEVNRFVVLARHQARMILSIARGSPGYVWSRRLRSALLALPKRFLRTYDLTRG